MSVLRRGIVAIALLTATKRVAGTGEGLQAEFSPSVMSFYQSNDKADVFSFNVKPGYHNDTVIRENSTNFEASNYDDYFDEYDAENIDSFVDEDDDDEEDTLDSDIQSSFNYNREKIVGVNLGGWLVTEPFISPSLYEEASSDGTEEGTPIDEYNYCKQLGPVVAFERLKKHWETWITENDFIKIKEFGFNAVRLPIGYWAFGRLPDDPYVFGQEEYLEKSIRWCRAHGLKLWIDLHGIPGSQNGFDNSGRRDVYMWMNHEENYALGIRVLQYIYDKYGGAEYEDVIIGFENLNEPLSGRYDVSRILKFDQDTYRMFRERSNNKFVYHDAFLPVPFWRNEMIEPHYLDTVLDHHRYEVFDPVQLRESVDGHITSIKILVDEFLSLSKVQIVGEWSAALTDCTKWLNGVGRGARYDNTFAGTGVIGECRFSNDYTKMTEQDRMDTRRIIEAQLDLYSKTNGFFFWTWKTESSIEWSLSDLARIGLFPVPLSDRQFPSVL
ncbi:hypothetical protein CANINC_005010 [Pichia inconspicua]|uniref:glucan 1,3-beta-glucosidase n=1 Tax=Pichia inconspicua TaxID=52247 RepID=A0A4V4NF09_9ASCO|nr:hypothetical protein CANINC_005010 [[Candida] inconspicua]